MKQNFPQISHKNWLLLAVGRLNPKLVLQQIVVWYTGLFTHVYDGGHAPIAPGWTPDVHRAGVGEPGVKYADEEPGHASEIDTRIAAFKVTY